MYWICWASYGTNYVGVIKCVKRWQNLARRRCQKLNLKKGGGIKVRGTGAATKGSYGPWTNGLRYELYRADNQHSGHL